MKPHRLGWALDNALDIHRSVWDSENALGVLDVEYFSKNFPGEPYLTPERTFTLMEPVYEVTRSILGDYGLPAFVVTTGQGYNFDLFVNKSSTVFDELVALGQVETALGYDYSHPSIKRGRPVPEQDGRAFDAMGKIFEYLCHRIFVEVPRRGTSIPLVVGDVACGNPMREAVSFDLSLYVNPIHTRSIRCPFSVYSKHMLRRNIVGDIVADHVGHLLSIPRWTPDTELPLPVVLRTRSSPSKAIRYAETVSAGIPEECGGFANLVNDYKKSSLYRFHEEYESVNQDDISAWLHGYDRFDLASIPPCAAQPLCHPNPLLLQPTNIRHVVRVLMALGWHPKHIAGLAYSKYARDFGWQVNFARYDANRWAKVWTRIYAGLVLSGVDRLEDFNCISHQEKGEAWMGMKYCPGPWCGHNLADLRAALLRRI